MVVVVLSGSDLHEIIKLATDRDAGSE